MSVKKTYAGEPYRVEQVLRLKRPIFRGTNIVRVAKRNKIQSRYQTPRYFVTALGAGDYGYGFGSWVSHSDLVPLSPIELLSLEGEL